MSGRTGIFPRGIDGAIRPNADTPTNPPQAYDPTTLPLDTTALYYSGGCLLRLRPSVINSIISEIVATVDRADVEYRTTSLQNLETAIRYLIQRGLPRSGLLVAEDAWHFNVTLDPPATHYNDFMTLTLVPQFETGTTQNYGYVRVNVNDLGFVPLLRNDGEELRAGDLLDGKPFIAAYYMGAFYHIGGTFGQCVLVGEVDFWIRHDGNDETGDGSENTPERAFRTIEGAWRSISRCLFAVGAHIILRLGIPGDYEGALIGPFGGHVSLVGDRENPAIYRIVTKLYYQGEDVDEISNVWGAWSLRVHGIANCALYGVNLRLGWPAPTANGCQCLRVSQSTVAYYDCIFSAAASNPIGNFIVCESHAVVHNCDNNLFDGEGQTLHIGIYVGAKAIHPGPPWPAMATQTFQNVTFSGAGYVVAEHGQLAHENTFVAVTNVIGVRHFVASGGLLFPAGQPTPGDANGSTQSGGQVL